MVTNDYKTKHKPKKCQYIKPKRNKRCNANALYGMSFCFKHLPKSENKKDELKLIGVINRE